jgi:murein DD-endopeptidase MepM/ murein hydrolase activator NlpD
MNRNDLRLLVYFSLFVLAFCPLIYLGSDSRYEQQVETKVNRYIVQLAGGNSGVPVPSAYLFPVADKSPRHIISRFGDARGKRKHQGIDIKADRGTAVVAIAAGTVERVKNGGNGGKQVWLRLRDSTLVFYAHLDQQWVEPLEEVTVGQAIGTVGNTGNARHTAPHLHFEIILPNRGEVDPARFFEGA